MFIAICDDDRYFRADLKVRISKYFNALGISPRFILFSNAEALLDSKHITEFDIIFLDVGLRDIDGIEAGRVIAKTAPASIIVYISGKLEYAPDSLEVDTAIRYMLKSKLDEKFDECMSAVLRQRNIDQEKVLISFSEGDMLVRKHSILFIESVGHTLTFHFTSPKKEPMTSRKYTMKNLHELLSNETFLRVDHSHLVNMAHIEKFDSDTQGRKCILSNGESIYISQRRYQEAKRRYLFYKGRL